MAVHTTLSGLAARVASIDTTTCSVVRDMQTMKARIATLEAALAGQRLDIPHRGDTAAAGSPARGWVDAIDGDVVWATSDGTRQANQ